MHSNTVNAALQILPFTNENKLSYALINTAVDTIKRSGLKYEVTAFETDVEGTYPEIMKLINDIHDDVYAGGAEDILLNLKIQSSKNKDITTDSKVAEFRSA